MWPFGERPSRLIRGRPTSLHAEASKVDLLVLQSTAFCNLDCSYCYLPNRNSKQRMARETAVQAVRRVVESRYAGDTLTVVWHAGEPLTLPIDYYERVLALIEEVRPASVDLTQSMQTNGTLIDDKWADFFKRHRIRLGVSIDGPKELHDLRRRTRRGAGTFDATMRGIRKLQQHGVPFHVISVVTWETLDAADALFDFYLEQGIDHVGFNIEEIEGINRGSSLERPDVLERYERFLERFLARRAALDGKGVILREHAGAASCIVHGGSVEVDNAQVRPCGIVTVDVDGNISMFSPELLGTTSERYGNFIFGNVHTHSLDDCLAEPNFVSFYRDLRAGVEKCRRECEYFDLCGGGAPVNKLAENGAVDTTDTLYCRLRTKAVVNVVLREAEQAVGLLSANPGDATPFGSIGQRVA